MPEEVASPQIVRRCTPAELHFRVYGWERNGDLPLELGSRTLICALYFPQVSPVFSDWFDARPSVVDLLTSLVAGSVAAHVIQYC